MSARAPLGVGVIGLGFMGRTHLAAYEAARQAGYPLRIEAVADQDIGRIAAGSQASPAQAGSASGLAVDPRKLRCYSDADALLADTAIDVVSICTHTDTHAELAIRALAAGKHVLVEKPLAVRSADARRVLEASRSARGRCMPAMCMRFWPGWSWLKEKITRGTFGTVRSAVFQRLGSAPAWAPDFYRDYSRSGGALVDLHIHDADFVLWCFGKPAAVSSVGDLEHVTTLYRFENGPRHVVAEAGWDHAPGFAFRMRYVLAFEQATAEFDSARAEPLSLTHRGETQPVPLESTTGWDMEIRHFVDAIAHNRAELAARLDDACAVAELLESEQRSVASGQTERVA